MANKEYIERGALIERLKFKRDNEPNLDGRKRYGLDSAISQVRKAPTADVAEVRRGEWINNNGKTLYVCSECGKVCPYDASADLVEYWTCNFCPNCGANMRGEKK